MDLGGDAHLRPMDIALAIHRHRFIRPFATAHGVREGTDAVFVRLREGGHHGYGEVALPPYLATRAKDVMDELKGIAAQCNTSDQLMQWINGYGASAMQLSGPGRFALTSALFDLRARLEGRRLSELLGVEQGTRNERLTMATIAQEHGDDMDLVIKALPPAGCLKVKVGFPGERQVLDAVLRADDRPVFLDANQGWSGPEHAVSLIEVVRRTHRLVGVEQPFPKDRWDLHAALQALTDVPVFGDESIQGMEDLERAQGTFGGINIKGSKCGGVDRALAMARRAHELGLRVMLGCMSEGSLGCGAMTQLQGLAYLVDLDGPWLIANDPFSGMGMSAGGIVLEGSVGIGVDPFTLLDWDPIGA